MPKTQNITPPHWVLRFFRWFCNPDFVEDLEGDLFERFERRVDEKSLKAAKWGFTKDVIRLFRPGIIRPLTSSQNLNNMDMYTNYLKIAFRNIRKQRISSSLNILGLALGIASSLLIILHLKSELSYENSYTNADNIYRISSLKWAKSSPPLKGFLEFHLPEASRISQVAAFGSQIVETDDFKAEVENGYYVDAEFLKMFDLDFLNGNSQSKFHEPYKIVLTETMANQFFGHKDPVGKVVILNDREEYEVIGVVQDLPKNSHLKMNYFVSMSTFYKQRPESWTSNKNWMVTYTYALFDDHQSAKYINTRMQEVTYDFYPDDAKEEVDNAQAHFRAFPIKSIHLHSHKEQEMSANSDITFIYIFSALAVFIILIACVNFINIFTTQAIKRSKEVGVRKVLGAKKGQLVFQFLSEAFITTLIATMLGLFLANLALPAYNELVDLPISYSGLLTKTNIEILVGLVLIVGFLSGTYPAFYIARQSSVLSQKSDKTPNSIGVLIRKVLVVFQFTVSITLLTSTLILLLQTNYLKSKDLGFNKDQVVAIKSYGAFRTYLAEHWEIFHSELTQHTSILNAALASNLIGDNLSVEHFTPQGADPGIDYPSSRVMRVDDNYIKTMGISLLEGRDFVTTQDSIDAFVLNKKAVESLGLENPIGAIIENSSGEAKGEIVGVIDDFHFTSLHDQIEPLILSYKPEWTNQILVKLEGSRIEESMAQIESKIKEVSPDAIFDYQFLDSRLDDMYKAETNMSKIVNAFSVLAIFISGLGLFGLMAYVTEIRTKEIGIRKVLGASGLKIVSILTGNFTKLILLSMVISIPASYFLAQNWLAQFAFKIDLSWWMFGVAGPVILVFALVTISFQTFKAALANPIDALRNE
ncbi:MAG: FtsX-like permease family protein [Fulvivirga sp.]|uniref:ABC transporter permease n=1 Tax=Fulvivirga sp. TaxID=1931237 RepID=UPI0032F0494D